MFEKHERIRVKGEKPGSPNEFADVQCVYDDGRVWIANLNMPYMGSISEIVDPSAIEKVE